MYTSRKPNGLIRALGALLMLLTSGCLQIEVRVKLNEDGSGRVTERIRLTRQFLALAGEQKDAFVQRLGREAALERVKRMGPGVTLAKHEVRDAEGASKESWAEFEVADINQLRLVCPWFARPDYRDASALRVQLGPRYKSDYYHGGPAGNMEITLVHEKSGDVKQAALAEAPRELNPLELQAYRDLRPILRDQVRGLRLRLTIESYAPIQSGWGVRGLRGGARAIDLVDISDANLDNVGGSFYDNEEVMLEIARLQFDGPNTVENIRGFAGNETLPVFSPMGTKAMWWTGGHNIWFPPSRALFDRYFAGKTLDFSRGAPTPPEKQVPARFEDVR